MLLLSINLNRNYTDITQEELDIILTCRKSVLVYYNTTWEKKTTDNFDITMESFDSAQIAELEGMYILDTLGRFLNLNNAIIYRDDGFISSNRTLKSKIQKKVITAFKYMGLKIEISSNLKIVKFLDVTSNLSNNSRNHLVSQMRYQHTLVLTTLHPSLNKFILKLILELTDYHLVKTTYLIIIRYFIMMLYIKWVIIF